MIELIMAVAALCQVHPAAASWSFKEARVVQMRCHDRLMVCVRMRKNPSEDYSKILNSCMMDVDYLQTKDKE